MQEISSFYTPFLERRVIAASSPREFTLGRRPEFLRQLKLDPSALCLVKQIHTAEVVLVESPESHQENIQADALITAAPGVTLGIVTADCIPVFIWDPFQEVIGLAHAGWRGVKAGIILKTIQALSREFESKPSTLQVALGPSIRLCCYEVGDEFAEHFPRHYHPRCGDRKGHMDLAAEARDQLLAAGVPASFIFDSGICTVCQNDRYFSARREKTDERILSVLQIR